MIGAESERLFQFVRATRRSSDRAAHRSDRARRDRNCRIASSSAAFASATLCRRPRHLQIGIVQRLHAQRQAIDAGGAVIGEARRVGAGGIGFQRDFDVVGQRATAARSYRACARRERPCISDGVPPPKKIVSTIGRPPPCDSAVQSSSRTMASHPAALVDGGADMAVEIAIGTFGGAERPMDVDAETAHGVKMPLCTSFSNARARWLMACFAAGSISPKVCAHAFGDEDRIVAEAVRAARREGRGGHALRLRSISRLASCGARQRQRADEFGATDRRARSSRNSLLDARHGGAKSLSGRPSARNRCRARRPAPSPHRPESSASAGALPASAAARALSSALSAKVAPVSSGSGKSEIAGADDAAAEAARAARLISRTLP